MSLTLCGQYEALLPGLKYMYIFLSVDRGLHEYGLDMNLMPSIPVKSSSVILNK